MELILIKDVENLGFTDDVVSVKPGYGRNFLIPQGYARLATESAKKVLAENLRQRAHKEANQIKEAKNTAEALKGMEVKLAAKVGTGNKLFGSISNADLSDYFKQNNLDVDKRYIQIVGGVVKALGQYNAKIRLHREVNVDLTFDVVAEKN